MPEHRGDVGLTRPVAGRLGITGRDAEQPGPDVPLGLLLRIADADRAVFQQFEAQRNRFLVGKHIFLNLHGRKIGEAGTQLGNEADDLLAGLIADAAHQVDFPDRELQQVADGEYLGTFERIAGTCRDAQNRDRCLEVGAFERHTQIDLLAAGRLDDALLGLLEDLLPRPSHLVGVVEPLDRVSVQPLSEELLHPLAHARIELLGLDNEVGVGQFWVRFAPLRQHSRSQGHLVQRHGRGVAFCRRVPSHGFAVREERIAVALGSDVHVFQRGTGQREVEQDQLIPLLGQRPDADVVRLDVPVDDAMPFQRGERREQVVAVPGQHLQAGHTLGSQQGGECPVAGLLQDEDRSAAHL